MVSSIAYYITLLRRDFAGYCSRELGKLGLSQGLLFFILYVGRHPGCTPGQLAAALHSWNRAIFCCAAPTRRTGAPKRWS